MPAFVIEQEFHYHLSPCGEQICIFLGNSPEAALEVSIKDAIAELILGHKEGFFDAPEEIKSVANHLRECIGMLDDVTRELEP